MNIQPMQRPAFWIRVMIGRVLLSITAVHAQIDELDLAGAPGQGRPS